MPIPLVKVTILPLALICAPLVLQAQMTSLHTGDTAVAIKRPTPYNSKAPYRTWSIKGKVLPFFLGNGGGLSGLLGVEYGFAKNQSIGIDGFAEYQENSDDMVADTSGVQHAIGDYWHSWERAVFLNYRCYFGFQRLRERKGIAPYMVVFLRYGKLDQYYDPLYPLKSYYTNHERHYSGGILVGATFGIKGEKNLGIDVNFGVFEKEKQISTVYLEHGIERMTHGNPVAPGFRLSVNISWWFRHR